MSTASSIARAGLHVCEDSTRASPERQQVTALDSVPKQRHENIPSAPRLELQHGLSTFSHVGRLKSRQHTSETSPRPRGSDSSAIETRRNQAAYASGPEFEVAELQGRSRTRRC
jgi:hypothetical protein